MCRWGASSPTLLRFATRRLTVHNRAITAPEQSALAIAQKQARNCVVWVVTCTAPLHSRCRSNNLVTRITVKSYDGRRPKTFAALSGLPVGDEELTKRPATLVARRRDSERARQENRSEICNFLPAFLEKFFLNEDLLMVATIL